ncbi:uncharacterized protein E0L32_003643 [Thyridium curvatum]|uniref:DNA polymerase epsilon subunit D n=1 Tax=Thyridium curvatum TaxID=1093900 RepID=A0A507B375_9PEZI|nr:uncharacterized protein E0L32_003643 [Thyridium curvatum]TPX16702.1 hypothetical protein E0L32_003643 [Thyridium curvatum]
MPPRKSDQAASRKSDVSAARFVLAPESEAHAADKPLATSEPLPSAAAPSSPSQHAAGGPSTGGGGGADASFVSAAPTEGGSGGGAGKEGNKKKEESKDNLTIEDLNLPKSIITRLAKGVLPPNTQIQANAILAMTKSASVFVNHLASAAPLVWRGALSANDITLASNKKTIMPQDVFSALDDIEFGFMRPQLEAEFAKFNQIQTSKRSTYRKKVAAAKRSGPDADGDGDTTLADASALSADATGVQADVSTHGETSVLSSASATGHEHRQQQQQQQRAPKKARTEGGGAGANDDEEEHSDAETEPEEEHVDEDEEDDDDVEEEEEEDDDNDDEGGRRRGEEDEDRDALEEREQGPDDDEALDGNESD